MEIAEGQKYLKTYWIIEKRKDLKQGEKNILQLLISFTIEGKECYVSEESIAQLFGVSKATITRGKRLLQERGLVRIYSKYINGKKVSVYELQAEDLNKFLGTQFIITQKPVPLTIRMSSQQKNKMKKLN